MYVACLCAAMTLRVEREAAAAKREEVKHELESTISKLSNARLKLVDEEVAAKCGIKPTVSCDLRGHTCPSTAPLSSVH